MMFRVLCQVLTKAGTPLKSVVFNGRDEEEAVEMAKLYQKVHGCELEFLESNGIYKVVDEGTLMATFRLIGTHPTPSFDQYEQVEVG
jgi:hypothetical protein